MLGEVYRHPIRVPQFGRERLESLARVRGSFTRREALAHGIHDRWLRRLVEEGTLERIAHGVYRPVGPPRSTEDPLLDACAAVPNGVICLLSSLAYHELTTTNPTRIDVAVRRDEWRRLVNYPPIVFHKFRDMTTGRERRIVTGRELRIFSAERSVCDTFRLRRELGKEIALEALQTYVRQRGRTKLQTLATVAHRTGVFALMQPYLEALT